MIKPIAKGITIASLAEVLFFSNLKTQPATISGKVTNKISNPLESILIEAVELNNPINKIIAYSQQDGTFILNDIPTPVKDINIIIPDRYQLLENYPDPFNPSTIIEFYSPKQGRIRIDVYNILGQHIKTLTDNIYESGMHSLTWDGRNKNNLLVSQGVYFYRMQADNFTQTKKMVLMHGINTGHPARQQALAKETGIAKIYDFIFSGDNVQPDTIRNVTVNKDTSLGNIVLNEGPYIIKSLPDTSINDTTKIIIDLNEYFFNDDNSIFLVNKGEVKENKLIYLPNKLNNINTVLDTIIIEAIDSLYNILKVSDLLKLKIESSNKRIISGNISDLVTDIPLENALVKFGNDSAFTDANGDYQLITLSNQANRMEMSKRNSNYVTHLTSQFTANDTTINRKLADSSVVDFSLINEIARDNFDGTARWIEQFKVYLSTAPTEAYPASFSQIDIDSITTHMKTFPYMISKGFFSDNPEIIMGKNPPYIQNPNEPAGVIMVEPGYLLIEPGIPAAAIWYSSGGINGNIIVSARVHLQVHPKPTDDLVRTFKHELGHALNDLGHTNRESLMNYAGGLLNSNDLYTFYFVNSRQPLNKSLDIDPLERLLKIAKSIIRYKEYKCGEFLKNN